MCRTSMDKLYFNYPSSLHQAGGLLGHEELPPGVRLFAFQITLMRTIVRFKMSKAIAAWVIL